MPRLNDHMFEANEQNRMLPGVSANNSRAIEFNMPDFDEMKKV